MVWPGRHIKGEGWGKPWGSSKWHYYRHRRALCGRGWLPFFGELQSPTIAVADDDCRACVKVIDEEAKSRD